MRTIISTAAVLFLVACGGGEQPKPEAPKPAAEAPKPAEPKEAPKPAEPEKPKLTADALGKMSDDEKKAALMELGKDVYNNSALACKTCHQEDGKGQKGVFPPLVGQKDHMGDCGTHAGIVINGMQGEIEVDGVKYNSVMTPQGTMLDDVQIAAVITYERLAWGNDYGLCTPEDVAKARAAGK